MVVYDFSISDDTVTVFNGKQRVWMIVHLAATLFVNVLAASKIDCFGQIRPSDFAHQPSFLALASNIQVRACCKSGSQRHSSLLRINNRFVGSLCGCLPRVIHLVHRPVKCVLLRR